MIASEKARRFVAMFGNEVPPAWGYYGGMLSYLPEVFCTEIDYAWRALVLPGVTKADFKSVCEGTDTFTAIMLYLAKECGKNTGSQKRALFEQTEGAAYAEMAKGGYPEHSASSVSWKD